MRGLTDELEVRADLKSAEPWIEVVEQTLRSCLNGAREASLQGIADPPVALSVLLSGDGRLRTLNRRWRQLDESTDVLSFPLGEFDGQRLHLGDIVISVRTAARQARLGGRSMEQELAVLLAHGFLHLLGFDHQTDLQEQEMERAALSLGFPALTPVGRPGSVPSNRGAKP